jgi:hypothetical protein
MKWLRLFGLQFINEDTGDFVILEDRCTTQFVGLGVLRGMFSPPLLIDVHCGVETNMLRLVITGVQWRSTILPKPVVDRFGRVICRTLGEAYEKKAKVWWYERDTVMPNEDGCTHSGIYD